MSKSKIEWTDYTWNPIKGVCPVGCWYCWARKMHKRFKWEEKLHIDYFYFDIPKRPCRVFVCSMMEMFHPDIPSEWRDYIFSVIEQNPEHTFQILTKNPQQIDRQMPDNVWLGVSVSYDSGRWRLDILEDIQASRKFLSYEPMFQPILIPRWLDWVILGRVTGYGHRHDPEVKDVLHILSECQCLGIPIFMKDNLRGLVSGHLIHQEFPNGMG